MSFPPKLAALVDLFSSLSEMERRETLIAYADQASSQEPRQGEVFDLEDIRKDEECTDTVAVFLRVEEGCCHFRITLGKQVQTLTRAMSAILCKGLDSLSPEEVLAIPNEIVKTIVGAELVRVRSQTVYYLLTRIKGIVRLWLKNHTPQTGK